MKIYDALFRLKPREQLPHPQGRLMYDFTPDNLDRDAELILMAGLARTPQDAIQLMRKHGAPNALVLLATMRPRTRADPRARLRSLLRRLEWGYEHDPHRDEFQQFLQTYRQEETP